MFKSLRVLGWDWEAILLSVLEVSIEVLFSFTDLNLVLNCSFYGFSYLRLFIYLYHRFTQLEESQIYYISLCLFQSCWQRAI